MRAQWIRTLFLVAMIAGCSLSADRNLAEKEVARFHALLGDGRFAEIYAGASQELKNGTSEADCIRMLDTFHRKAGAMQKTQKIGWRVHTAPPGTLVSLTYRTQYAGGEAIEEFDYRIKDGTPLLVRYGYK